MDAEVIEVDLVAPDMLKTLLFCVDVMSHFNVFVDLMDISIKLLIVW